MCDGGSTRARERSERTIATAAVGHTVTQRLPSGDDILRGLILLLLLSFHRTYVSRTGSLEETRRFTCTERIAKFSDYMYMAWGCVSADPNYITMGRWDL